MDRLAAEKKALQNSLQKEDDKLHEKLVQVQNAMEKQLGEKDREQGPAQAETVEEVQKRLKNAESREAELTRALTEA
eukprot:2887004-Pleurochrysis_carterae.AAC.1